VKRLMKLGIKAVLVATLLAIPITGIANAEDGTIEMVVSPNVLSLESNGGSISIHTDIGYVAPADVTLEVNGEPVDKVWTFTDSCGNLVVKCSITEVKGMVTSGEDAIFDLICNYNGGTYTGSDTVRVIQVIPQKP